MTDFIANMPKKLSITVLCPIILLLFASTVSALDWDIENLDFGIAYTSIAVNAEGHAHIGYTGANHAYYDGVEKWHFENVTKVGSAEGTSIALDSNGYPHMFFRAFQFQPNKYVGSVENKRP